MRASGQKWKTKNLSTENDVLDVLAQLQGRHWLNRGQPKPFGKLVPSIDRNNLDGLLRRKKLTLERQSIDLFRSTVRYWATGEESAATDDVLALMVMRHYGVPTRLLDWSTSPYIALYFAIDENDDVDGELWCFDKPYYEEKGAEQWKWWPETTVGGKGPPAPFDAKLTMFLRAEPPKWFVCQFYPRGFPRQVAQQGAYSLTADFGRDHADAISTLLGISEPLRYSRYIIAASLKPKLRTTLREKHGIWRGSLFPDSTGAAETAKSTFDDYYEQKEGG
jgi:hypothetical protein